MEAHMESPTNSISEMTTWAHLKPLVKVRLRMLWTHLRRCFGWRLNLTKPTSHESNLFDNAGIENPTLRSYLSWRRSQMLCSVPVLMSAALTGLSAVVESNKLTDKGNFVYNLPNIANFVLLIAVLGAIGYPRGKLRMWPKWRMSSKIIRVGFIVSFILPIIPAIIPLRYLASDSYQVAAFAFDDNDSIPEILLKSQNAHSTIRVGIDNFISTLPVLISFPSALLAGSLRIRGLLPDSSLSSWILTTTAPFISIVILAAAILIIQFVGDATLMLGVFFRCAAPWLYVVRRGLYVKEASEEREKKVNFNQTIILITNLTGLGLIIYWMFTQDFLKSEEATNYAKFILEVWGRVLATTVVFTDMLLRMTLTNWKVEKSVRGMDDLYESIERGIRKNASLEANVTMNSNENDTTLAAFSESHEKLEQNGAIASDPLSNNVGKTLGSPVQGKGKTKAVISQHTKALDPEESTSGFDDSIRPTPYSNLLYSIDIESGVTAPSTHSSSPNNDLPLTQLNVSFANPSVSLVDPPESRSEILDESKINAVLPDCILTNHMPHSDSMNELSDVASDSLTAVKESMEDIDQNDMITTDALPNHAVKTPESPEYRIGKKEEERATAPNDIDEADLEAELDMLEDEFDEELWEMDALPSYLQEATALPTAPTDREYLEYCTIPIR